MSLSYR